MEEKIGQQTLRLNTPVYVISHGNCVSAFEEDGPLKGRFDTVVEDEYFGEKTFELAEVKLQKTAITNALEHAGLKIGDLGLVTGGDLLNQCIASGYSMRDSGVPFVGLYGACSTMALSTCMATLAICSGFTKFAGALTSSHFCSAERQFRYPLEYGGQRPPSAQHTVTGSGAVILSAEKKSKLRVSELTLGRIVDFDVTDINNMGGAMAPAAMDTLTAFFTDTHSKPDDYDLIVTGDLGQYGSDILRDIMRQNGLPLGDNYNDCGLMIYDRERQDAHAGGSGCGCSASVLTSYILPEMELGNLKNVLFMATGALMSPTSVMQNQSIPAIAHLVHFVREDGSL